MSQTAVYSVPDISCDHCKHAIESAVARVEGVASVSVDVNAKMVTVVGEPLDEQAVFAAIGEAGYEVV